MNLMLLYRQLYREFGPQHWWPTLNESRIMNNELRRFEICVGAILTQNTAWVNVEKAIRNLHKANLMSPEAIIGTPRAKLEATIRSSGYFAQKAKKLKLFSRFVVGHGGLEKLFNKPLPELRSLLLNIWGIGPETADSMILYAAGKPIFVIDTYTKRLLNNFGIKFSTYDEYQSFFQNQLPRSAKVFNEFHALIVAWGKKKKRLNQGVQPHYRVSPFVSA